ncbi:hypothetical protein AVEN_263359-1 [Araneus ventricosus]|uniref:Uncharacterized protein n=1 Tax=Araneus ventricosus TaxID=182803 RepID=A0A4Y2D2B4_ARAVE|nr:hypothetical protein AVEN_263359-1 [Araneus ventricosus]
MESGQERMEKGQEEMVNTIQGDKKKYQDKKTQFSGVFRNFRRSTNPDERMIEEVEHKVQMKIKEVQDKVQGKMEEVEEKVQGKIDDIVRRLSELEDRPIGFSASPELVSSRQKDKPLTFDRQTSWTVFKTQFNVVSYTNGFNKVSQLVASPRISGGGSSRNTI